MLTGRSFNSTLDRMLSLNRVLDEALASSWNGVASRQVWVPAMDVVERQDAYLISVELPGVDPAAIDVGFEQNVLTVRGSKAPSGLESKNAELRIHSSERVMGNFERAVRLPEFVDGEGIAAEFTNGVLYLTIPKAKAAQPKKIRINGVDAKQIEQ
jgi:HSP20 family protein